MKTAGIIAEYNPFHNGHKYHIEQTKKATGAEGIIVVMSGSFVQRGEYAICDKWSRTEMALFGGADLVIELPCVYACQSAEYFAKGAVSILESMKCDYLSFGTEADSTEEIMKIADFLKNPNKKFNESFAAGLKSGISYPKAISEALSDGTLNTPNNVLAVEYIKHIKNMIPVAIKRQGSQHDQEGSASDIRNKISNGEGTDYLMPETSIKILRSTKTADKKIFENLILYKLRTMPADQLKNTPYVSEGLENRILESCHKYSTYEEILNGIKTKRYTMARIRRILTNALLDIKKEDINQNPKYVRILGMSDKGREILANLRDNTDIPIITKIADAPSSKMLDIEINATNIYSVLTNNPSMLDYKTSPIIKK